MRRYIATVVLILFVIPSLVHAAWWNPFSWFKKSVTPPKVLQVGVTKKPTVKVLMPTTTPVSTTTPSVRKEVSVKPAVAPSLGNTDQSIEIEKLKKEVEELKRSQTRTTESSEPLKSVVSQSSNPLPHIETWEEQEKRDFLYADQKGWTNLTSTNALGEKRYYRKEGTQWIRKNSEAEAAQPYESPEKTATRVAFRDNTLNAYTRLVSTLTQYRDMFSTDIEGMNNIAKLISDSGTTDERFVLLLKLTILRIERISKIRDFTNETINHYRSELSKLQSYPLSYFTTNNAPGEIADFFSRFPQMYSSAITDQDSYNTSVNEVATPPSFISPAKSIISCSYSNGGTKWSCVDSSHRATISCFYTAGGTVLNCQ